MDQLDRHREPARPRREALAEPAGERDAQRPQVLAAQIEQVVRRRVDDPRAARHGRQLGLEAGEIVPHPALEAARAAQPATVPPALG